MKLTLQSTTKIVNLNNIPCRVWEGETESGIKCHAFISRVAIDKNEPNTDEFVNELHECKPPTTSVNSLPLNLIL